MTRDEKKRRILKEDGKAFAVYNIEIRPTFRSPIYTLSKQASSVISGTGLLKLFELNPSQDGPSFVARWDGGSRDKGKQERYDLDIDIEGVAAKEKRHFKQGQGGYAGHHTTRIDSDRGWKYQVCIRTPDGSIFEGTVCFNLHRKVGVSETLHFGDTAKATVHRNVGVSESLGVSDTAEATVIRAQK